MFYKIYDDDLMRRETEKRIKTQRKITDKKIEKKSKDREKNRHYR